MICWGQIFLLSCVRGTRLLVSQLRNLLCLRMGRGECESALPQYHSGAAVKGPENICTCSLHCAAEPRDSSCTLQCPVPASLRPGEVGRGSLPEPLGARGCMGCLHQSSVLFCLPSSPALPAQYPGSRDPTGLCSERGLWKSVHSCSLLPLVEEVAGGVMAPGSEAHDSPRLLHG